MAISVSQGKTKSQKLKFFKSRYLTEFLRQGPKILHVIITFIGFKISFSNMGSEMTPSLISQGGPLRPPHGSQRIRYPMGGRVKDISFFSSLDIILRSCIFIFQILNCISPGFLLMMSLYPAFGYFGCFFSLRNVLINQFFCGGSYGIFQIIAYMDQ